MHGPPAADSIAAALQTEAPAQERAPAATGADTRLRQVRAIEREVMALRGLLAAGAGDAGRGQEMKEEMVRLLSKVILFRAGLGGE